MRVLMNGANSRWFSVESGLRQGCPLLPLLLNTFMMEMVEELERAQLGVKFTHQLALVIKFKPSLKTSLE